MTIKKAVFGACSVVGVIAVAAIANVAGREVTRAGIDNYQRESAVSNVDRMIANEPYMHELRRVDPERADAMALEMKSSIRNASSPEDAKIRMLEYSKRVFTDYRKATTKASDEAIRSVVQTRVAMLKAVREHSSDACGRVAMSGAYVGMPSLRRGVMEDAAMAVIRAGHEGQTTPVARPEPSEAGFREYGELLRSAGLSERELEALDTENTNSLSTTEQCKLAIVLQEQALAMTGPQAKLIMATIVAE